MKAEFKDEKPVTSRKGISRSSLLSSFRKELVLIQPRVSLIYAVKLRFDLNILFHFGCSGGIYFYFSVRAVQLSRKKILDLKSYLVKFEASGKTANAKHYGLGQLKTFQLRIPEVNQAAESMKKIFSHIDQTETEVLSFSLLLS